MNVMTNSFKRCLSFALPIGLTLWALIIWAALCTLAHAEANPDAPTPVTEWVYQGAALADMLTTLDIKNHGPHCVTSVSPPMVNLYRDVPSKVTETCYAGDSEMNPLLGSHPSDAKVVGYFALTGALHYLITRELVRESVPAPIVQTWEALTIGLEVGMVAHNYSIGLRARF